MSEHLYNCECEDCQPDEDAIDQTLDEMSDTDFYLDDIPDVPETKQRKIRKPRKFKHKGTVQNPIIQGEISQRPREYIEQDQVGLLMTPDLMDKWSEFRAWEQEQRDEAVGAERYSCYHGLEDDISELEAMIGEQGIEDQTISDAIKLMDEVCPDVLSVALINYALQSAPDSNIKSISATPFPLDEELELNMLEVRNR